MDVNSYTYGRMMCLCGAQNKFIFALLPLKSPFKGFFFFLQFVVQDNHDK